MFKLTYHISYSIGYSIWNILITIITGKLVKVSTYHQEKNSHDSTPFNMCSDKYIKTNCSTNVSDECKKRIIDDFISHLTKDPSFTNPINGVKFPLFNGKEIVGESSYYKVIQRSLRDYIQEQNR